MILELEEDKAIFKADGKRHTLRWMTKRLLGEPKFCDLLRLAVTWIFPFKSLAMCGMIGCDSSFSLCFQPKFINFRIEISICCSYMLCLMHLLRLCWDNWFINVWSIHARNKHVIIFGHLSHWWFFHWADLFDYPRLKYVLA